MEKPGIGVDSSIPNQQAKGPLPLIQELRAGFESVVNPEQSAHQRALAVIEHADQLRRDCDLNASQIHSRIFLRSALITAHHSMTDFYYDLARQDSVFHDEFRKESMGHLLKLMASRAKLKRDVAQFFIDGLSRGEVGARKLYVRLKTVMDSAARVSTGNDGTRGYALLHGMLAEGGLEDGLTDLGVKVRPGDISEDLKKKDLIISGPEGEVPLQVKSAGTPGSLRPVYLKDQPTEIRIGLDPSAPNRLNEQQIDGLVVVLGNLGVEATRAA